MGEVNVDEEADVDVYSLAWMANLGRNTPKPMVSLAAAKDTRKRWFRGSFPPGIP